MVTMQEERRTGEITVNRGRYRKRKNGGRKRIYNGEESLSLSHNVSVYVQQNLLERMPQHWG